MAAAAFAAAAEARETEDDDDPSFTTAGAVTSGVQAQHVLIAVEAVARVAPAVGVLVHV